MAETYCSELDTAQLTRGVHFEAKKLSQQCALILGSDSSLLLTGRDGKTMVLFSYYKTFSK